MYLLYNIDKKTIFRSNIKTIYHETSVGKNTEDSRQHRKVSYIIYPLYDSIIPGFLGSQLLRTGQ
jgi:hypothetical protein